jgi:TPP-dependent indolepyruvate ferredoxin oxidoreductase alpha subunit
MTIDERHERLLGHRSRVRLVLPEPVAKRPPSFCTGCP